MTFYDLERYIIPMSVNHTVESQAARQYSSDQW